MCLHRKSVNQEIWKHETNFRHNFSFSFPVAQQYFLSVCIICMKVHPETLGGEGILYPGLPRSRNTASYPGVKQPRQHPTPPLGTYKHKRHCAVNDIRLQNDASLVNTLPMSISYVMTCKACCERIDGTHVIKDYLYSGPSATRGLQQVVSDVVVEAWTAWFIPFPSTILPFYPSRRATFASCSQGRAFGKFLCKRKSEKLCKARYAKANKKIVSYRRRSIVGISFQAISGI